MLRAITAADVPFIDEWIALDMEHSANGMTAGFFFHDTDSVALAIEDKAGPIMYVRIKPLDGDIVRLDIQFDARQRRRTAVALAREFPVVCERMRDSGTKYAVFASVSEPLILFCEKRFGFVRVADSDDYLLTL